MSVDIAALAAELLQHADQLLPAWLPEGARQDGQWVWGDPYGAKPYSGAVNLATGQWIDVPRETHGTSLVALYAALRLLPLEEAAQQLDLALHPPAKTKRGRPRGEPHPATLGDNPSAALIWEQLGLQVNHSGVPFENLSNAMIILQRHPELAGKIWADDFLQRILTTWNGPKREWADGDDLLLTEWMQRVLRVPKISLKTVSDAAQAIAFIHRKNEVTEWLNTLQWDTIERLPTFLSDGFGCEQNDYTAAVGRCWLVSLIARALKPGCKADYVPVFEGIEGIKKSTAMKILGGDWFVELHEQIMSKDFMQGIQGSWLIEIAELNAFSNAQIRHIKGVISCQNDYYRASYGRRHKHHPRRCIFAATTNEKDWNDSDTGARRFWPVICVDINTDYLTLHRDQLFAEALTRFRAGEAWWDVPAELAREQQEIRRPKDLWQEPLQRWLQGRTDCNCAEVLTECIGMKLDQQDMRDMKRAGRVLRMLGWESRQKKINGINSMRWFPKLSTGGPPTKELFGSTESTEDPY